MTGAAGAWGPLGLATLRRRFAADLLQVQQQRFSDAILGCVAVAAAKTDGVGFEPTVPLRARRFSRPVP